MALRDNGAALTLFLVFLAFSAAAFIIAWAQGRRWGDLSSRRRYGEALTEEEQGLLRRSRRSFWIWAGVSLVMAALAFYALR